MSDPALLQVLPANKRPVRPGGLMRCCLGTLTEADTPSEVGTVLSCKYENPENENMIVAADGIWQWNR